MLKKLFLVVMLVSVSVSVPTSTFAGSEGFFYKEANLIAGYSTKDHWVDKLDMMNSSVGFELYRKFSNDYGDFLTTDIQMRVAYDSKKNSHQAWGLEIHNAWIEHKFSPNLKLRAGHFVPSFGLEPVVDTHSTLLQTLAEQNIGYNRDWGAQLRGSFPSFDYEASLQIGSGMSVRRRDDSYLAALRIGTPQGRNLQGGVSVLSGRVLQTDGMRTLPKNYLLSNDTVTQRRVGLDGQYLYGPLLFKGEVAYGQNDSQDVLGYLTEVDYAVPSHQNLEFQLQYKSWINDIHMSSSDDNMLTFGAAYKLNQATTLRAAFEHDFGMMDKKTEDRFVVQFYFLGA